ncbi:MAG: elongation factor P [candidate division Zixibacteria bacterium]|nr:elongation factor P [candidate division Zixibacteria bacterium]
MITAADFRKGMRVLIDGEPYIVVDFSNAKMGRGRPHTKAKLKHLITGSVFEKSYLSNESFKLPDLENRKMQYLYNDPDGYNFMDSETFEQTFLTEENLGDSRFYLMENHEYSIMFFEGRAISLDLPASVVLEVTDAEPAVKGDTVSNIQKGATLETGLKVKVPLFVKVGNKIKVDTRTGAYIERSN